LFLLLGGGRAPGAFPTIARKKKRERGRGD